MKRALGGLLRRRNWEQELADELQTHIEARTEHLMRSGLSRAEAERKSRIELGGRETLREECRRSFGFRFFDELQQDVRYSLRTLGKSPGFTAVAVISLALGIGANTIAFSVLHTMVLRALPVASPESLYAVEAFNRPQHSYPNYADLRDRNTAFSGMAAYRIAVAGLDTGNNADRIWGYLATGNYFDVLGLKPAAGRFYRTDEDVEPGANPYAVISYGAWMQRFGGAPSAIGRTVRINGMPFTIVGVAPKGFHGTEVFYYSDIWIPMSMQQQIESFSWLKERRTYNIWVVARLKNGVTAPQAESNLAALAAGLRKDHPVANEGLTFRLARPGLIGDMLRRPAQAFLGGVMLLASLVLLAACANLGSLMAARASDRHRELAIRMSIGAGRGRVMRQLATESMCLSILGGLAGCALAVYALSALTNFTLPGDFPGRFDVTPDLRVFLITALASLLTGLLFGLAPARQALRVDPNQTIRGSHGDSTRARRWAFRDVLLAGQVALCAVLITASVVAVRGMSQALTAPIGFDRRGVSMAWVDLGLARYNSQQISSFHQKALAEAQRLPGVTSAAYAGMIPLGLDQSTETVLPPGETEFRRSKGMEVNFYDVSPGYFRTMGTRLLAGRDFTWADDEKRPKVAIVNQQFGRKLFGNANPVGRTFRDARGLVQIIGVVEDGKYETMAEDLRPALFRSAAQIQTSSTILLVRSEGSELVMAGQLREVIRKLDPGMPTYMVGGTDQMLAFAMLPARAATVALSAFGALAIMLSVTGIYGLASYSVSRRIREIGIRIAVGAGPTKVLRSVLGRIAALLAVGGITGILLGTAADRILANIVYHASARDPRVVFTAAALFGVIGLLAASAPARAALKVDPVRALREE